MRHLVLLVALAVSPLFGATEWTSVKSPNFELFTTASAGDARKGIEYFEQVRDFFMRVKSQQLTTRLPVTIIVFRNPKEFKPYTVTETAAAYFTGDQSRDYIVMSGFSENHKDIAVHEYMHLLIRHMELKLPVWLNEGIAEVYSTLRPLAGKIVVGNVPQGRGWSLASQSWLKLPHLFSITRDSPEYNEKNRAGVLYAQSWLLTHMLMLDERYREHFGTFVGRISAGMSAEEALYKTYAKTADQVQADLGMYFRQGRLNGVLFDAKLEKLQVGEPHPVDPFDVELALSRLTAMLDRREEAAIRMERLANENPKRWEPVEALGQLAWRKGDFVNARKWLRKAVEAQPQAWSVYWDYARVSQGDNEDRKGVVSALRRLVELNPTHLDGRLMLGQALFDSGQYGESLATFAEIKTIDPERAPRLFLGKAHAALRLNDFKTAKSQAEQAVKYAEDPLHKESAESILTFLQRREEYEKQGYQVAAETAGPPTAQSGDTTAPVEKRPVLPSVRGVLQEVDCSKEQARLLLQAGQRQVGFLIVNPDHVIIRNAPGTKVDLTCGKQPPGRNVLIEFEEKPNKQLGTIGEVRGLEFLK
jgi:tetratricopeptide (TPR) repeat protein